MTPSDATYRVDDCVSLAALVPPTTISPLAVTVEIVIPASVNAIITASKSKEFKAVTVEFDYGSPVKTKTEEYIYGVKNLKFVP